MHPHRPKLADVIAQELSEGIRARKWVEWLPQERVLAEELKVSRSTLRQALNRLDSEGLIERLHSKGNRILARKSPARAKSSRTLAVNLLLPGLPHEVRPTTVHWVEELRAQLAGKGGNLRILHAKSCYTERPERPLDELMRRNPADCWIVRLSTAPMQRWLAQQSVPVIVAGTCHPGIDLPFVDIDHRALSRHATAAIITAGHRRISLFVDRDSKGGDLESERGFTEAVEAVASRHPGIEASVTRYQGTVEGVQRQLERLLKLPQRPTALLVTQSIYCLTIWSHLGFRGVNVPADISIVTQVGTPDLSYLVPEPTSYRVSLRAYANKILRLVEAQIAGDVVPRQTLIIPEFVPGKSLAPPRA